MQWPSLSSPVSYFPYLSPLHHDVSFSIDSWRISEYSECSKSCGGGVQTRTAQCIHEIARGEDNALPVPDSRCEEPVPRTTKFCNVFDCEAKWVTESWSSCSRSCDEGVKTRKVQCVREVALGTEVVVSDSECKEAQPTTHKPCNLMPCRVSRGPNPLIMAEDTLYVQKEPLKRLSLKIGGKAVVFEGTTLKIRCPHRRLHEGPVIEWMKDDQKIVQTTRLHFTGKNGLRIKQVTFSDAGIYSCSINSTRANLILSIKPDDNRRRGFVSHSLRKTKKGKKSSKKEGMDNTTLNALNPFGSDWEGSSKFVSDEHKTGGGEWKKEKMMIGRLETSSVSSLGVARSSASRSSREPISQLRQLLSDLSSSLSATYASETVLASTV